MTSSDPIELLRTSVRSMTIDVVPELSDGELVDRIVLGDYIVSFDALGHRRRKRRRVFIGAVVGLAASGGIAVAALNRQSEPRYPEAGIMCRAAFGLDANGEAVAGFGVESPEVHIAGGGK